jgi:LPXTG-motif cell wall-anchored protein
MRLRRTLVSGLTSAAACTAGLVLAAPAWAMTAGMAADPPGANGTVKIDGAPYADANNNEPHVTCEFRVEFFNFDKGERADIILAAQPPSGKFFEVARLDNRLVSDDGATGGSVRRDPDEYFQFSADDLDLADAVLHPRQGYHIKLTVDRKNHPEWTEKHKVFWLAPCPDQPSPPPSTPPPGGGGNGGGGNGGNGNGGDEGSLPVTGTAVGGLVAFGAALVGGGAGLLFFRRRKSTFTS